MKPSAPAPTAAPAALRWSGRTDCGPVRPNNEDVFLALKLNGHEVNFLGKTGAASLAGDDFVFAVSDGMGGARSGEVASRITVDRITKLLPRAYRLGAAGLASGFHDVLGELYTAIHRDLLQLGQSYEECAGMGATLSLCWFTPTWMYHAHLGDSRIYWLPRAGGITQLTPDHSHVGWLRRNGKLTEREARAHPGRHALSQALGAGHQFIEPHLGAVSHGPGDRFLICSDGLVDGLWDRQLEALLREEPHADAAGKLVAAALGNSGRDNTTAVVIELVEPPAVAPAPTA